MAGINPEVGEDPHPVIQLKEPEHNHACWLVDLKHAWWRITNSGYNGQI